MGVVSRGFGGSALVRLDAHLRHSQTARCSRFDEAPFWEIGPASSRRFMCVRLYRIPLRAGVARNTQRTRIARAPLVVTAGTVARARSEAVTPDLKFYLAEVLRGLVVLCRVRERRIRSRTVLELGASQPSCIANSRIA